MKFTKLFTITTLLLLSSMAIADQPETYSTDCEYLLEGDRTGYKGRTVTSENIDTITMTGTTPEMCVYAAQEAVKKKYPGKYLAGGQLRPTTYFNVTAELRIIHKDNVDFPKQQLESTIKKDRCVILKTPFELESPMFGGDDYYEGKIAFNSICKK